MVDERDISDVVAVRESRIVIQQVQDLINCNQPNLQRRLTEYGVLEYNQAADYLTFKTLALGESWTVTDPTEKTHLECVSSTPTLTQSGPRRPTRLWIPNQAYYAPLHTPARVMTVVPRSRTREDLGRTNSMGPLEYQPESAPRRGPHLRNLKEFLKGEIENFSRGQIRRLSKEANLFLLDSRDVLFRLNHSVQGRPRDRYVTTGSSRVTSPGYTALCARGFPRWSSSYYAYSQETDLYWYDMYADVNAFVKECVDCASGKGRPPNQGPSPGNIEPTRPFDCLNGFCHSSVGIHKFPDYAMWKPMNSTTAQEVAEAYEERVFLRFGASAMIRNDQDPKSMREVFKCLRELLGSRQRATLGYRLEANGQQERSVRTVIRSDCVYVAEADQSYWDDHAEPLMFALNTSFGATCLGTTFYLVHGWDAQGTVLAILGPKPSGVVERTAYECRRKLRRDYSYAQACAEDVQRKAKRDRAITQTRKWKTLSEGIKAGFSVGDALTNGTVEITDDFRVRLKVSDTGYRVNPWVHISRLKSRALFPKRPTVQLEISDEDDLDAALLPEDNWEMDNANDEYEVEENLDLRWSQRIRTSKRLHEYLIKWKGYDESDWVPLPRLNGGTLLYEFNQGAKRKRVPGPCRPETTTRDYNRSWVVMPVKNE
ncbi:reverse transcriptase [Phytophthora megakarya]|uniref:Reverse transcriptase n=1 Tax=Phytophthora megakarya TaxID=4795 RepID=A0A225W8I3_9STRA|nr:reverse transcriptase [Phytophthora megakarya]